MTRLKIACLAAPAAAPAAGSIAQEGGPDVALLGPE
jgi:hypothetical protein